MTTRDSQGQPLQRAFNAARLSDRAIDELIGMCRGVLADGVVTDGEASFLLDWMNANREAASRWPAEPLYRRLREMLVDHTLDLEEQGELLELLHEITGGAVPIDQCASSLSSSLPLCKPPPVIAYEGHRFCLTGKFAHGSRKQCEAEILRRGGTPQSTPTKATSFVVIGCMGSSDWIHSTHGRKIEEAVELRSSGVAIGIVSEEHWVLSLSLS